MIQGGLTKAAGLLALASIAGTWGAAQADTPATAPAVQVAAQQETTGYVNPAAKYLEEVVVDQFNPDVTDASRASASPKRGGKLYIRTPTDFQELNSLTLTGQPERVLVNHLSDSLVDQDPQTLEFFPEMAWYWREADLIKTKSGEVQEGRIVSMDDESVTFVPGAWKVSVGRFDVAEFDQEAGYVVLTEERGGTRYEGTVTAMEHTIVVDEVSSSKLADGQVTVPMSELDSYDFEIGTEVQNRPFAKKNCAFEFYIRDGITWHDGEPFTADDVLFSYQTIMNPVVDAQSRRNYYKDVNLAEIIGDGEGIKYHYVKPYFQALAFLGGAADSTYFIPKHIFNPEKFGGDSDAFAEAFNQHLFRERPIYTGAYKLKSWERNNRASLVRNENYWKNDLPQGAVPRWEVGQPYIDELIWVLIKEPAASVKELQKGALDVDIDVEPNTWVSTDTNTEGFKSKMTRADRTGFLYTYIGWNLERKLFKNPDVRRALAMLIPRQEIADDVHHGLAFPVSGPFYSSGPGYDHSVKAIPYDPKGARRILARAGYLDRDGDGTIESRDGEPLVFNYSIHNARDYHQKIADIIKENIEQAGIKMTIDKMDWTIFSDRVRDKNFDAVRFAWGTTLESDPFQIWHSSQMENKGDNFVSYKNERVDEICVEIRETFDPETRWKMAQEMHRIVYEEQPYCFLFGFKETYFINRNLRGVKLYANAYPHDFTEWYWNEVPKDR